MMPIIHAAASAPLQESEQAKNVKTAISHNATSNVSIIKRTFTQTGFSLTAFLIPYAEDCFLYLDEDFLQLQFVHLS